MTEEQRNKLKEVIFDVERIYNDNKLDFEYDIKNALDRRSGVVSRQIYSVLAYLIEEDIIQINER